MNGYKLVVCDVFSCSPETVIQSLKSKVLELERQLKMTDVPRCLICMVRPTDWLLLNVSVLLQCTHVTVGHHRKHMKTGLLLMK